MKRFNNGRVLLVIVFGGLFFFNTVLRAAENGIPFKPGEKMEFQVKWAFIPAGTAEFSVLPIEKIDGEDAFHFVYTARTNDYIDKIYKVRDRIDSFARADMTHAILYKKQHDGKTKKKVTVSFDWTVKEAQYSIFGEKIDPVSVLPGTFDPLSVFYFFRLHRLDEIVEIKAPVTDGKKCIIGTARVIRREMIEVANQSYDTYLVEPEIEEVGGVFNKSNNARLQMWVTADDRHIPVRIKSRVMVGNFVAELVSFTDGNTD
ncbi:MAG: DUF3108 domain-containing protein [Deltaproteobacteria bacterium]|nr:DUF3108 domain-containing protein [Deltaproteobacteria bacterium]